ncbi:MAG: rRNA maturation RNase YbeY [Vulcanimicrobiaceae bacterium]
MIYLRNRTRTRLDLARCARTTRRLLVALGRPHDSVSLSFVGDTGIRRLNRDHRGVDRPTDVLSFPFHEPFRAPDARRGAPEILLGEIVISLPTAARQARAYDATLRAEVERLLIHGLLHLLGHDHEDPHERDRMRREERRLAKAIALSWPYASTLPRRHRRVERHDSVTGPRSSPPEPTRSGATNRTPSCGLQRRREAASAGVAFAHGSAKAGVPGTESRRSVRPGTRIDRRPAGASAKLGKGVR